MTSLREFNRNYRVQADRRDEVEVDLHAALARSFARHERTVRRRLQQIRRGIVAQAPTITADDRKPHHRPEPLAPQLRTTEVFMGGFDDDLAEEVGPALAKHGDVMGSALIGGAAWHSARRLWAPRLDGQVSRLKYVGQNALTAVDSALVDSAQAGDTFDAMASRIGGVFDGLAGRAAGFIARVEAVALLAGTSFVAATAEKVATEKMWVTQQDERVRPTHDDAEGQTVPLGDPFLVGDGTLMYPGDPDGPIEETANCRCELVYPGPDGDVAIPAEDAGTAE